MASGAFSSARFASKHQCGYPPRSTCRSRCRRSRQAAAPRRARPPSSQVPLVSRDLLCQRRELRFLLRQILVIRPRPQRGEQLRLHLGPVDIQRLIQVHHERDRPAADERQVHVVPVLSVVFSTIAQPCRNGGVVVGEHQAIARLPDRRFLDVADADRPLAFAEEAERDGFLVLRLAAGQHEQRLPQFGVELGIGQLDAADVFERDAPQPFVGEQVQERDRSTDLVASAGTLPLFRRRRSCRRSWSGRRSRSARRESAPSRSASVGLLVRSIANVAQRPRDRVLAAVADGRDPPAAVVLQDHALEQVVDVLDVELQLDLGVASTWPSCSKKATPRAEHDDPLDRDVGLFLLILGDGQRQDAERHCREGRAGERVVAKRLQEAKGTTSEHGKDSCRGPMGERGEYV